MNKPQETLHETTDLLFAAKALAVLGHKHRLAIFRLLMQAGAGGMPAAAIAQKLKLMTDALPAQLETLENAGLIQSRRCGQSISYATDFDAMRRLSTFLFEDCCTIASKAKTSSETNNIRQKEKEVGGRSGPDPVRYGDWEKGGICIDF